jgi:peptide deformylase
VALLKIAKMGHPVLSSAAEAVSDPTSAETAKLVEDMVETMLDAPGVGLAAPQVHVPKRVVVYYVPDGRDEDGVGEPITALINPVLTPVGQDQDYATEACLSLPGMAGQVPRFVNLHMRAQRLDGSTIEREVSGYHARLLQHECDHLDGILYPQRMDDLSTFGYIEELAERSPEDESL